MTLEPEAFGPHLRSLRLAARLTQEELAERAGISPRTVRDLELGASQTPRVDTAKLLADALGLAGAQRDGFLDLVRQSRPLPDRAGASAAGDAADASRDAAGAPADPPAEDGRALLGREDALAALQDRLADPAARVVTLLGPGGVGKTRLALEAARRAGDAGRPVAWAPLEALGSPEEVLPAIARAVGAAGAPQADPAVRIADAVAGRDLLLVLDNCEHVIEAAAAISEALAAAPTLRLLATSREALRIGGEERFAVAPLPVPAAGEADAELAANPAVALFLERARLRPGHAGLGEVRRIVGLVDGLPLAIELAAAQAVSLSVEAMSGLLERSGIEVLDSGRRDVHARLRSMEDAVRWSYDLLDDRDRRLLRAMSVFRGGCDVETLADVCDRLGEPGLVRSLPALVAASLVTEQDAASGARRLLTLSPIRLFAEAELERAGERAAAELAHRRAMRELARRLHREMMGPEVTDALAAMDRERDNLSAALARAVQAEDAADAVALAARMSLWWEARGEFAEGERALERALALDLAAADPEEVSLAGRMAALFGVFLGRFDASERHVALIDRCAREAGYLPGIGVAEMWMGELDWYPHEDAEGALAHFRRGVELLEPGGPTADLAQACARLGDFLTEHGDPSGALPWLHRSVEIRRGLGNTIYLAAPLHLEAAALAALGRDGEARAGFLAAALASGDLQPLPAAYALLRLAALDAAGPDPGRRERAALLIGAADAVLARHRVVIDPTMVPHRDGALAALAAALGEPERDRLLAEGRALSEAEALALAGEGDVLPE